MIGLLCSGGLFQITFTSPEVKPSNIQRSSTLRSCSLVFRTIRSLAVIFAGSLIAGWWTPGVRISRRRAGRPAPHLVLKPQSPHHKKGVPDNIAGHLGVT